MTKLKIQVQMSIDGFIAGLNHEMDWITMDMDPSMLNYIAQLNRNIDCILLGRGLADGFIPHWKMEATDPTQKRDFVKEMSGTYDFAEKMYKTKKVVFTKTKADPSWENTVIADGNLVEEVNKIKTGNYRECVAYGGARFLSSLIEEKLVDEFHLFLNPVAIGTGMPIFNKLSKYQYLKLVSAIPFECGVSVLHYSLDPDKI
jgi:dihydrofolate reductase